MTLVRGAAWGAALILGACGCVSSAARCAESPFPAPGELLARPGFDRLRYHKSADDSRRGIDVRLWADARFEFEASLRYHYSAAPLDRDGCPTGVSLLLSRPITGADEELALGFLSAFAEAEASAIAVLRAAFESLVTGGEGRAAVEAMPGVMGEVVTLRSANRGELVVLGFYERGFYAKTGALP